MRLLFNTNALWSNSGYAMQAIQFLPKIVDLGHKVGMINFYGQEGGPFELSNLYIKGKEYGEAKIDEFLKQNEGKTSKEIKESLTEFIYGNTMTMYPRINDVWGADAMIQHSRTFKPDYLFTLQDIWVLNPQALKDLARMKVRWCPIVPIDMEPAPPAVINRLKLAYRIVSYSPFGYRQLKKKGFNSTLIPHTIETDIFKPLNRDEIRDQVKIPKDIYLFGMVAANKDNPPRKAFQYVMDAFAKIHKKYPKTGLYIHTYLKTQGGFQIEEYAKLLGIEDALYAPTREEVQFIIKHEDMAKVYSMMDCFLLPSLNEGFGVPLIEAQACGIPAITSSWTSMQDLVIDGETGYLVDKMYDRFTAIGSFIGIPDPKSIYEKMEKIYLLSDEDKKKMSKKAREFVVKNYDLEHIFKTRWEPFLKVLKKELDN